MRLDLPPRDPRIHVFSVAAGPIRLARRTYLSGAEPTGDETPLAEAFGASVDATHAEVFAVEDVAPLTLRDYLAQAHDIPQAALSVDRARLDAVRGQVAILAPRAVDGLDALDPEPQLVHLGSYAPTRPDDAPRELPPAARGRATPRAEAARGRSVPPRTILWIVLAALGLAGLILLLL